MSDDINSITFDVYNSTSNIDGGIGGVVNSYDSDEYLKFINSYTKKFAVIYNRLNSNCFKGATSLKKVWIPSTCKIIEAQIASKAPFYGLPADIQIFTDIVNQNN